MEDGFAVVGFSEPDVEQSRHKEMTFSGKKVSRDSQAKNWVFTWNYQGDVPKPDWPETQFLAYQAEVCPKTGRHHLQGYVQFKKKLRFSALKKLQKEVHWEMRKGTHKQALDYVTKTDTRADGVEPVVVGDPVVPGTSLAELQADLDEGMVAKEVAQKHFTEFMRYHKSIDAYIALQGVPRDPNTPVFTTVLWGPPGTGKTRRATHMAGEDAYWVERPNSKTGALWYDGYSGQKTLIFDEFYGWIPRETMCRILDRYPYSVQKKGGMIQMQATNFIITSNKPPEEWWPKSFAKDGLGPMQRRLNGEAGMTIFMPGPGVWEPPTVSDAGGGSSSMSEIQTVFNPAPCLVDPKDNGLIFDIDDKDEELA